MVAVKQRLGLPVRFIGVGEGIDDLIPFTPEGFVEELIPRTGWKHLSRRRQLLIGRRPPPAKNREAVGAIATGCNDRQRWEPPPANCAAFCWKPAMRRAPLPRAGGGPQCQATPGSSGCGASPSRAGGDRLGITFEPENALIKPSSAETICKARGLPPSPMTPACAWMRWAVRLASTAPATAAATATTEANNDKLLDAMKDVPAGRRGAKFVSAVCFILPDGRHLTCMGECPGSIAFERLCGDYGFGYDPLFIPADCGVGKHDKRPNTEGRSYAQLTPDEKDAISHRGNALAVLEQQLPGFLAE